MSLKCRCSCVKRLYDDSFHEWKIIPLRLIKNVFANSFSFYSNLKFKRHHVKSFPDCYRDILLNRKRYLSQKPGVPSCILSQNLWYNQYIQIEKEPVHLVKFSDKKINTVSQFYNPNNLSIIRDILQESYKFQAETYFQWICIH